MSASLPTHRRPRWPLAGIMVLAFVACVTINVYFPEAEVKDLSEAIEEAVANEAAGGSEQPADEPPTAAEDGQISWIGLALHLFGPSEVYAQDRVAAPKITSPAIRQIIRSRGGRLAELVRYKRSGVLGESNQALVEIRNLGALPLAERATVQKLVRAENADRERMFREIAAATGADLSTLPRIRETYAKTLRENANPGELIQLPDGTWTTRR